MQTSPFDSLFGKNTTTTVRVVERPPSAEVDSFQIPSEILIMLWITAIMEMELSILVII